jgi:hypothetical protein
MTSTATARRAIVALALIAAGLPLIGCKSPGAVELGCRTEAHLVDTSGSTAAYRGQWPTELTASAHETLVAGDHFVASTFTSGPGTIDWAVTADGCKSPEDRPNKHERWAAGQAGIRGPKLTELTRQRTRGGSDPLAALEAASKLPRLTVVRIWSDLVVQDDGVDLSRPVPPARIAELADEWTPRLKRLRGVRVVALHAGRGVDSDVAVRQSEQLMRTVLQRAGATLDWQPVYRGTSGA